VYAALAALAFLENILPILPADVAIALGGFLTHSGTTRPLTIFLIAWVFNTAGAMLVYTVVRRSGRRIFDLPIVRRLMAPESLAVIERDYLRLGTVGLIVARFLPGIRAVVPPFAGLFRIPVWRVLLIMALVSGIWYGAITWIGVTVGSEFDQVQAVLHHLGRTSAIIAAALAGVLALVVHARRRRREEPVVMALRAALGSKADAGAPTDLRHAAQLVIEIAYADAGLGAEERAWVELDLRQRWGLEPRPLEATRTVGGTPGDGRLRQLGARLSGDVERERRLALIEQMWQSAFADRSVDPEREAWLLDRAAELLGLGADEVARAAGRESSTGGRQRVGSRE
jgi:membrane protein DedA with SNARE-associated domain